MIVFYADLKDAREQKRLVYAIIGLFVVDEVVLAANRQHVAQNHRT
jgi:hypothetical protein